MRSVVAAPQTRYAAVLHRTGALAATREAERVTAKLAGVGTAKVVSLQAAAYKRQLNPARPRKRPKGCGMQQGGRTRRVDAQGKDKEVEDAEDRCSYPAACNTASACAGSAELLLRLPHGVRLRATEE